ncbi:hypothetical protein G7046_g4819 [Stylonectria norvegica]|nr:hypothetical protein G7046_g4819 [Stylonectria norvegica]
MDGSKGGRNLLACLKLDYTTLAEHTGKRASLFTLGPKSPLNASARTHRLDRAPVVGTSWVLWGADFVVEPTCLVSITLFPGSQTSETQERRRFLLPSPASHPPCRDRPTNNQPSHIALSARQTRTIHARLRNRAPSTRQCKESQRIFNKVSPNFERLDIMSAVRNPHAPSLVDDDSATLTTLSTSNLALATTTSPTTSTTTVVVATNGNTLASATESTPKSNASGNANGSKTLIAKSAPRPGLKSGNTTQNMNGPLYMQTFGNNTVLIRRLKRKEESTCKHLSRWFVENQIGLSFNLITLLFCAHIFIPKTRVHTSKFFQLSYYNPDSGEYGTGFDDACFILFCIVVFTGLRAATMEYLLAPLAKLQGITKRKALTRFSEQAWLLLYYMVFWTLGMYIYCQSPYYLNMKELWTDWPNRELGGLMKGYVLMQWAFWLQQMIVINIEERRKDHWQMLTHHIVTTILISSCYSYHHTRIGNFILVIMDVVDLFLPLAKCLKYSGFAVVCDIMFGLFVVAWFMARHVFYMMACWSIYAHTPDILPTGCFKGTNQNLIGPIAPPPGFSYLAEPFFNSTGLVCYNETVKWAFLTPLLFLQAITIVWFTMIVRVVIGVLKGQPADDVRSDDEGEEEEDEFEYEEAELLEEDVGVEDLDLRNWERRSGVKKQGSSSGVSLPGHSDRKELLNRIGCEKQIE